jgi:hypothetical protein
MSPLGVTDVTESHESLFPDELADEQAEEDVDIGDDEPEEAPDPVEDDESGIELADPDEFEMMRQDQQGEEAG